MSCFVFAVDAATVMGFLKHFGLDKEFKVGLHGAGVSCLLVPFSVHGGRGILLAVIYMLYPLKVHGHLKY